MPRHRGVSLAQNQQSELLHVFWGVQSDVKLRPSDVLLQQIFCGSIFKRSLKLENFANHSPEKSYFSCVLPAHGLSTVLCVDDMSCGVWHWVSLWTAMRLLSVNPTRQTYMIYCVRLLECWAGGILDPPRIVRSPRRNCSCIKLLLLGSLLVRVGAKQAKGDQRVRRPCARIFSIYIHLVFTEVTRFTYDLAAHGCSWGRPEHSFLLYSIANVEREYDKTRWRLFLASKWSDKVPVNSLISVSRKPKGRSALSLPPRTSSVSVLYIFSIVPTLLYNLF